VGGVEAFEEAVTRQASRPLPSVSRHVLLRGVGWACNGRAISPPGG